MWQPKKFSEKLNEIKRNRVFGEHFINSKEKIYEILADQLCLSIDTVKSWTRAKSSGPSDEKVLSELAAILMMEPQELMMEVDNMDERTVKNESEVSDIVITDNHLDIIDKVNELVYEYIDILTNSNSNCSLELKILRSKILSISNRLPNVLYTGVRHITFSHANNRIKDVFYEIYDNPAQFEWSLNLESILDAYLHDEKQGFNWNTRLYNNVKELKGFNKEWNYDEEDRAESEDEPDEMSPWELIRQALRTGRIGGTKQFKHPCVEAEPYEIMKAAELIQDIIYIYKHICIIDILCNLNEWNDLCNLCIDPDPIPNEIANERIEFYKNIDQYAMMKSDLLKEGYNFHRKYDGNIVKKMERRIITQESGDDEDNDNE